MSQLCLGVCFRDFFVYLYKIRNNGKITNVLLQGVKSLDYKLDRINLNQKDITNTVTVIKFKQKGMVMHGRVQQLLIR